MRELWARIDRLGMGQRIVLVIGVGIGLVVITGTLSATVFDRRYEGGWFAYAPARAATFLPDGDDQKWKTVASGLTSLVAVVIWGAFGVRALQTGSRPEDR